jgi:hypothetical protein
MYPTTKIKYCHHSFYERIPRVVRARKHDEIDCRFCWQDFAVAFVRLKGEKLNPMCWTCRDFLRVQKARGDEKIKEVEFEEGYPEWCVQESMMK